MWASTRPRLVRSWRSAVRCACRAARNRWMLKKRRKREKGRACTCRDAVVQGRTRSRRNLRRGAGAADSIREPRLKRPRLSVEIVIHLDPSLRSRWALVIFVTRRRQLAWSGQLWGSYSIFSCVIILDSCDQFYQHHRYDRVHYLVEPHHTLFLQFLSISDYNLELFHKEIFRLRYVEFLQGIRFWKNDDGFFEWEK